MTRNKLAVAFLCAGVLLAADSAVVQARKKIADKKYDEAIAQLETEYKSKPQPDVKKALGEAYLAKADSMMTDEAAPPRVKYPGALRAYREVLKYDKENKKAQQGIATIEGIYKSMGRPIPQ
jgi:tetratricopeptide (TPR) repeat protein